MSNAPQEPQSPNTPRRGGMNLWFFILILLAIGMFYVSAFNTADKIDKSAFESYVMAKQVKRVDIGDNRLTGSFIDPPPLKPLPSSESNPDEKGKGGSEAKPTGSTKSDQSAGENRDRYRENFIVYLGTSDESREKLEVFLREHKVPFGHLPPNNSMNILWMFFLLLPIGILLFFWISYRRSRDQMMGGGFLSGFSKSPAKRYDIGEQQITFKDVAGLEGVKADLNEIVDYLKDPEKFQRLGGRVPKGVLLNGPPGTGKTLLARAVAGEADVPFYSVSGSEFIQMFVGVGASRVRDLFQTAKDNSPSIIFIDEIDAVGRQRGAGLGGGHDEREQTLNQILSEMDGFTVNDSSIVLAATNRPDVLDPALLRPGRFDRHVTVSRPTLKGRREIFKVHVRDVPLADNVNLDQLAAGTVGLTGADIRNMVNEAALWAARQDKKVVEKDDFEYARDKILMGAKREEVLQEDEKKKTAYHEAGHTLTAWKLTGANPVHKVTIVPRGRSLGSTQMVPSEDRMSMSENELRDHLTVLLGGRAAEKLIYDETTVGAENDLERATSMARRMVTHWGMSERLGPVSYKTSDEDPFLGREIHQQRQFSEHTMEVIDQEVTGILHQAAKAAYEMLQEYEEDLCNLAETLLKEEELDEPAIAEILGPSIHTTQKQEPAAESTKPVIPTTSQPTSDTSSTTQQVTRDHHRGDIKPHDNPSASQPPPASGDS
jgi:cell division protease FtsH